MTCTVRYNQKEYALSTFEKIYGKAKSVFNPDIDMQRRKSEIELMREQGYIDETDGGKYGVLVSTSKGAINKKLIREFDNGGIRGLKKYVSSKSDVIFESGKSMYGDSTIKAINNALKDAIDEDYLGIIEKVRKSPEEVANEIGVTEQDIEDYQDYTQQDEEIAAKIDEYYENLFTENEFKLYNAIRKTLRFQFDLAQRSGKILSADGRYASVDEVEDAAVEALTATDSKWKSKDKWYNAWLEKVSNSKLYSKIVSIDNLLMKMGFQKGSAEMSIVYTELEKANQRQTVESNTQKIGIAKVIRENKLNNITRAFGLSYKDAKKESIPFADGEVELTIDEILHYYSSINQPHQEKHFVYSAEQLADLRANKKRPNMVQVTEIDGHRKESKQVVTQEAWDKIKKIAEKPEYKPLLDEWTKISNENYEKVSETLYIITGQRLPQIERYYPTMEAKGALSEYEQEKEITQGLSSLKERKVGIKVLAGGGFVSKANRYISATNYYSNMARPMQNAKTLMTSEKLARVMGEKFKNLQAAWFKWFESREFNQGTLQYGEADKFINQFARLYYRGVLGWNPRVILKQPISALHAWNFFGDKKYATSFGKAFKEGILPDKKVMAEIKKYSPLMGLYMENLVAADLGVLIDTGNSDNFGLSMVSGVLGKSKLLLNKASDKSLEGVRRFDVAARVAMWEATKDYVNNNFGTESQLGTAMYFDIVADIHEQALYSTQQTFDTFHRSEIGRSTNTLVKSMMMFTTQLQKQLSLLDKAVTNYVIYGRKEDRKKLINTSLSVLVIQSMTVAAIDMGYNFLLGFDDDDEEKQSKFLELASQTFSNSLANIPGMQIVGNDVANAIFNTDLYTKPASTPFIDFFQYGQETFTNTFNRDKDFDQRLLDLAEGAWYEGSKYGGIPIAPFRQIVQAVENRK